MDALMIKNIKKEYNFKNPILLKKFETRGKRHAFLIMDNKKKYVLKIIPKDLKSIKRIEFMSEIKSKNFNIPAIIEAKSEKRYLLQSSKIIFLLEFINQKESRPSTYFFSRLGRITGEFHGLKFEDDKIPDLDIGGKIKKIRILFLKKKMDDKIKKDVINFLESFPSISDTTTGLIHGDISYFNVLGRKKLFFVDLDDISRGPVVYDLGQMIAFMFNLIPFDFPKFGMKKMSLLKPLFLKEGFEFFLKNYSKKIKLSYKDIEILPYMAMLACAENIYLKSAGKIFKWNYKRFKIIKKERDIIVNLLKKYASHSRNKLQ